MKFETFWFDLLNFFNYFSGFGNRKTYTEGSGD